ncbi:hypothetical protein ACFE04_028465 [Oxalis oulophora]
MANLPRIVYLIGLDELALPLDRLRESQKLPGGVKRDIVQWVTPYVQKEHLFDHIADPRLKGRFDRAQLRSTVLIAMKCTDGNSESRPSMVEVVEWLKGGSVGRRTKEVTQIEDMVKEDNQDKDKNIDKKDENHKTGQSKNTRRRRAGMKKM